MARKNLKAVKVKKPVVSSLRPAAGGRPATPLAQALAPAPTPVREVVAPPQYAPYDPDNDPAVRAQRARQEAARADGLASVANRRTRLDADFGLGANADPNNPWSKMALLRKSFQTAQRGNETSMAARGQYSSGAYQRAQRRSGSDFARGEHDLKSAHTDGHSALDDAAREVNANAETADLAALGSYLDRLNALNALVPSRVVEQGGEFSPLTPILGAAEPAGVRIKKQPTTGKKKRKGR